MSNHELTPLGEYCIQVAKEAVAAAWQVVEGLAILACIAVCPLIYLSALVYLRYLEGRSNCLVWAVRERIRYATRMRKWSAARVICKRNARGRRHFQVRVADTGNVYEWYAKGASSRGYLGNLWYKGEMRQVNK